MEGTLQQQSIEVEDALGVQELFYQNEWTDGFPIVPPVSYTHLTLPTISDV